MADQKITALDTSSSMSDTDSVIASVSSKARRVTVETLVTLLTTKIGTLPSPWALKFTGAVSAEYDGSTSVTVNIPEAETVTVDSAISSTSTNPVQNKVVKAYVDNAVANIETTGDSSGAATLSTARLIDGVSFDGSADIAHYGTCTTAQGTLTKTVSLSGFSLVSGAMAVVKFNNKNTAESANLNINSTGAKTIYLQGAALTASNSWSAGDVVLFVYDGTQYNIVGMVSSTTSSSGSDGKSAYEYATSGGYTGTESEFYTDLAAVGGLADALAAI